MASVDSVNASSSSSSLPFNNIFSEDRKKFDVFLSFRGSNAHNKFTDQLYSAIKQKGIRTFWDDEQEKKNLKVLPIFHHVYPSDVGNQTGAFADAFAKHEERFKDVNLWRLALRKAASIPGLVLNYG
ncbi:disease resistance protein RPV1-like [Quercus suber]|uniref:disease resistance protein RPV1-like n=1 Tax=Quercus suber TaxID=58331 RepID=UPI0032DED04D